jgi:RimJ/RimL family protein N-acetyltransferase
MDLTGVDLTTEVVRTARLLLRPYRPEDADAVFAACQDPGIRTWITAMPQPYRPADAQEFVTVTAPAGRVRGSDLGCAVEADGELVGSAGLHALTTGRLGPEVGYWVAPWARRRGIAAEAADGLARWALAHGAHRVHLFTDVANTASQTVAERAGFAREGVVRGCLPQRDGTHTDAVLFGRLPTG